MDVFQHLIRACFCQTKMFANEQQQHRQVWTAEFICPAKKPIPQWSFHRKCFALDPQPQQDKYGTEYQSSPFLPFLTLEGPPGP